MTEPPRICGNCHICLPRHNVEGIGICRPLELNLPFWLHAGYRYVDLESKDAEKCKAYKPKGGAR